MRMLWVNIDTKDSTWYLVLIISVHIYTASKYAYWILSAEIRDENEELQNT